MKPWTVASCVKVPLLVMSLCLCIICSTAATRKLPIPTPPLRKRPSLPAVVSPPSRIRPPKPVPYARPSSPSQLDSKLLTEQLIVAKRLMSDWYRPSMTREEAISHLRDKDPGQFILRDSTTVRGGYGLCIKVSPEQIRARKKLSGGSYSNIYWIARNFVAMLPL